jgi:hypothetical protein
LPADRLSDSDPHLPAERLVSQPGRPDHQKPLKTVWHATLRRVKVPYFRNWGIYLTQVAPMGCGRGGRSPAPGIGTGGLYRPITRRPTARARKTPPLACAPARRLPERTAGAIPGHGCAARAASNHKILGLPESSRYPNFRIYDLRSSIATRLSAGGLADEWVTQLSRQGDAKMLKRYSRMKLQMKREALQKLNRKANESRAGFDTEKVN